VAAPRKRDKDVQTDAYDSAFSVHRHIESAAGKLLEGAGECYARGHDEAAALLRDLAHELKERGAALGEQADDTVG
jgi:hypothetical protein